jgi:hypothetical protein
VSALLGQELLEAVLLPPTMLLGDTTTGVLMYRDAPFMPDSACGLQYPCRGWVPSLGRADTAARQRYPCIQRRGLRLHARSAPMMLNAGGLNKMRAIVSIGVSF